MIFILNNQHSLLFFLISIAATWLLSSDFSSSHHSAPPAYSSRGGGGSASRRGGSSSYHPSSRAPSPAPVSTLGVKFSQVLASNLGVGAWRYSATRNDSSGNGLSPPPVPSAPAADADADVDATSRPRDRVPTATDAPSRPPLVSTLAHLNRSADVHLSFSQPSRTLLLTVLDLERSEMNFLVDDGRPYRHVTARVQRFARDAGAFVYSHTLPVKAQVGTCFCSGKVFERLHRVWGARVCALRYRALIFIVLVGRVFCVSLSLSLQRVQVYPNQSMTGPWWQT
jgi:hypothetical protein